MPLSEHVYCVAITLKMMEGVEQQICINFFFVKLGHSSTETIPMIQKATSMGNWSLAASSQQHTCSCIMSHAEFFGEMSNHPVGSAPLQSRFGVLQLLTFPKAKITFEREEISDCQWDSGKYYRASDGNWENCVRSHGAYFEGDWGVIVLYTMFLVSCMLFNKCLYFSYYMAGYLLDRPYGYIIYITYKMYINFLCLRCTNLQQNLITL